MHCRMRAEKLDIVVLPWASAKQQLQLVLSGDEKIDCFYSTGGDAAQYMRSGQIVELSELVDAYGTNLKEVFGGEHWVPDTRNSK